jgi:hypothetical protein
MVIRDLTDLSGTTSLVRNAALFLHVPGSITEQALVDVHTVIHNMLISFAPMAVLVVLVWAVFPSIHEVVEPSIKHGSRNV